MFSWKARDKGLKPREKFLPPRNKTVTPDKVIDTYSNLSPFIFFSTTDNVKFTSSERVLVTNCVEATIEAFVIVQNAAAIRFAGHLDTLELYFGSSSPETINCVTEVINTIYKLLSREFSCFTFFNITKPKVIYNRQWFNKFPGAGKNPRNEAADAPNDSRCKLPFFSDEEMKYFHIEAMEKWLEQQIGVSVNIDLCLLPPFVPVEGTVRLISSELASIALDLDLSEIKINKNSTDAEFSIDNLMATGTLLALSNVDNWGSFIAFFTEPLSKHYLQQIMRNVALSNGSLGETIISNRSLGGTIDKPI